MSELKLEDLKTIINLESARVKPFDGFIFLCGGPSDVKSIHPVSLRDTIHRELVQVDALKDRIRVAEDYKNWAANSIYSDLVLFESHLAELSSVIVVVLESPGAIAELGLFAALEEFQEKLLIFVDQSHYQSESFIRLGPIQYLENRFNNAAHCHRFLTTSHAGLVIFDHAAANEARSDLIQAIAERVHQQRASQAFSRNRWLHRALLICDILNIFSALTIREIRDSCRILDLDMAENEIRQTLYLLGQVEFTSMLASGSQRFYIALADSNFLTHGAEGKVDLDRFRFSKLELYNSIDKKRFRAIQEFRRAQNND